MLIFFTIKKDGSLVTTISAVTKLVERFDI